MEDEREARLAAARLDVPNPSDMHPKLNAFFDYWLSLNGDEHIIPFKKNLDPLDIPSLLPNIFLIDAIGMPPRFRFRLMGGSITDSGGPGRKDRWVDEVPAKFEGLHLSGILEKVIKERVPKWYKGPPLLEHDRFVTHLEGIMCPLTSDGTTIDTIACLTVYSWKNGKES